MRGGENCQFSAHNPNPIGNRDIGSRFSQEHLGAKSVWCWSDRWGGTCHVRLERAKEQVGNSHGSLCATRSRGEGHAREDMCLASSDKLQMNTQSKEGLIP